MTARTILSTSLLQENGKIRCRQCLHVVGTAGRGWKAAAPMRAIACADLPGAGSKVNPQVVLRQFFCGGCAGLLDTEVAMPDDPFLDDIVSDHPSF
jgi:acetone carboxylase gamma subunit